ncbi:hypothetical protein L226DRAFT_425099, partial [Lentinus tigrinus ALCF2SS1-7]
PTSFSPDSILQHVTILIVTGDQPLILANDIAFRNCLVAMRPKMLKSKLPTQTTVCTWVTNNFITYLE